MIARPKHPDHRESGNRDDMPVILETENGEVELVRYADDATLADLKSAVEDARIDLSLVTAHCAGCGRCCYFEHLPLFGYDLVDMRRRTGVVDLSPWVEFPVRPVFSERQRGISHLKRQYDFDERTATLLYEYHNGDPVSYAHDEDGGCVFLEQGFCGNYGGRAYTCALYACTMGDRLSMLQESIVRQGVWHSYSVEGWIDPDEISHNPFCSAASYDEVLISSFDVDLSEALEALFFYY